MDYMSSIAIGDFFLGYDGIIVHIDDCAEDIKTKIQYVIYHPINGTFPYKKCININDWFENNSSTNNIIRNKKMHNILFFDDNISMIKPGSKYIKYHDYMNDNHDNVFTIDNVVELEESNKMYIIYHYDHVTSIQYSMPLEELMSTITDSDIESNKYVKINEE